MPIRTPKQRRPLQVYQGRPVLVLDKAGEWQPAIVVDSIPDQPKPALAKDRRVIVRIFTSPEEWYNFEVQVRDIIADTERNRVKVGLLKPPEKPQPLKPPPVKPAVRDRATESMILLCSTRQEFIYDQGEYLWCPKDHINGICLPAGKLRASELRAIADHLDELLKKHAASRGRTP